jgi:hypothetical protein
VDQPNGIYNLKSFLIITCGEYMFVCEYVSRFKIPSPGNPIREDLGLGLVGGFPGWVALVVVTTTSVCQNLAIERPFPRWDVPCGCVEQS